MARRNWLFGARQVETTPAQVAAAGAAGGYGIDPVDGDRGYVPVNGGGPREQPWYTLERARIFSITSYRSNPMARAIIDTYTSFVVGDTGVKIESEHPEVLAVAESWWTDPKNKLDSLQSLLCRDWLLQGELVWELMVGELTGVVRYSPIDPGRIKRVNLDRGNPLWHKELELTGVDEPRQIVTLDDVTGLRSGDVAFFPSWRALITDRRGSPFLTPVIDDLSAYAQVLSNLVDRTALARYVVFDVEIDGDQDDVDAWVANRGGKHLPPSGSIEAHNQSVKWTPMKVDTGSFEDTNTATGVLTNVAGGAGLAKTWLAEPDGANRATSLSMAEPVRRRVNGVQQDWLVGIMTECARFAIDQAVKVGRLPREIVTKDAAGNDVSLPPSKLVRVVGPEIAAADAQFNAQVLLNLSTGLDNLVKAGALSKDAAAVAARKAWEQFVGNPMPKGLELTSANADAIATELDVAAAEGRLRVV